MGRWDSNSRPEDYEMLGDLSADVHGRPPVQVSSMITSVDVRQRPWTFAALAATVAASLRPAQPVTTLREVTECKHPSRLSMRRARQVRPSSRCPSPIREAVLKPTPAVADRSCRPSARPRETSADLGGCRLRDVAPESGPVPLCPVVDHGLRTHGGQNPSKIYDPSSGSQVVWTGPRSSGTTRGCGGLAAA